jgi:hypothetical protein
MPDYKWSSVRTMVGHVIGEFQRKTEERINSIGVRELLKTIEAQMREHGVTKAPPITSVELMRVCEQIQASKVERLMLETLVRTCIRLGNLKDLRQMKIDSKKERWTFLLSRHKTRSQGVHGIISMRTRVRRTEEITVFLTNRRIVQGGRHQEAAEETEPTQDQVPFGFRRGGGSRSCMAEESRWREDPTAPTLHTSDGQVLEYLGEAELE